MKQGCRIPGTIPGSLEIIIFKLNLVTFVCAQEGDGAAAPAKTVLYHHLSTVNQTEPGVRDFRGVVASSDGLQSRLNKTTEQCQQKHTRKNTCRRTRIHPARVAVM